MITTGPIAPGTAATEARPEAAGQTMTLAFTGDTLIHIPVWEQARVQDGYDFSPMFAGVRSILAGADLAICHLEVPLSSTNQDLSSYPRFSAPHELAEALAYAGYDGCSTASNHSYDRGAQGVVDTVDIMEAAGLPAAGMARRPDEAWRAVTYQSGELTVAQISATYWLNGFTTPAEVQPLL